MIRAAPRTSGLIEVSVRAETEFEVTLFIVLFHACFIASTVPTPIPPERPVKAGIPIMTEPTEYVRIAIATTATPKTIML